MNLALGHSTSQTHSFVLHQSMSLLRLTAAEMTELLTETAQSNPHLLVRRPRRRFLMGVGSTDILEQTAESGDHSLFAHVEVELADLLSKGGMLARVVTCLMEELDPSGWMTADPDDLARLLGIRTELVLATLQLVQKRVSPVGLFARTLSECLYLQLQEEGEVSAAMNAVLAHLPVLETGGAAALAKAAGVTPADLRECLDRLRRLDPKPGARFGGDASLARAPDARVARERGRWLIRFNRETEPSVEIAPIPRTSDNPELAECLKQARQLKHALDLRHSATRKVIEALVAFQSGFLTHGPMALRPLTMGYVAGATGFHPSTVSRVLTGYLIETPQGVMEARLLCPGAAAGRGGTHCKRQVMARICALLADEDPQAPLSDGDLVAMLQGEGVAISRRVAANYRKDCGFPRAALRRQQA
ncbi:RNA polymerase factor sigma-54 [Antarctobacter jejuensis]|uniref:RNA polymerase factor sigma-54 n=1 Tax=Antarctobacter jejuensis TaxID=1439938 RepID=UPI003FD65521